MQIFEPYHAVSIATEFAQSTSESINQKRQFPIKINHSKGDEGENGEDSKYHEKGNCEGEKVKKEDRNGEESKSGETG